MSYTIFTSNPTALIPQPGRAVNTFPSGLVRVDQTYLGLTSQATTHRATLAVGNDMPDGDSSPCIDGLKIFPEVQERRREDGFTEYIVSAYGRWRASPHYSISKERIETFVLGRVYRKDTPGVAFRFLGHGTASNPLPLFVDIPQKTFVTPAGAAPDLSTPDALLKIYSELGIQLPAMPTIQQIQAIYPDAEKNKIYTLGKIDEITFASDRYLFTPDKFSSSAGYDSFATQELNLTYKILSVDTKNFGSFDEHTASYGLSQSSQILDSEADVVINGIRLFKGLLWFDEI